MKGSRAAMKTAKLLTQVISVVKDLQEDIDDLKRAAGIKTRAEILVAEEKKAERKAKAEAKFKAEAEARIKTEAEAKAKAKADAETEEVASDV